MARDYWSLLDRKYTGTSLLLTGAAALSAGWVLCWFYKFQDTTLSEDNEEAQSQADTYSEQDGFSEASTPRDVGVSGRKPPRRTNTQLSYDSMAHSTAAYKQAILIRTDLKMVITDAIGILNKPVVNWPAEQISMFVGSRKDCSASMPCISVSCQKVLEVQRPGLQSLGRRL